MSLIQMCVVQCASIKISLNNLIGQHASSMHQPCINHASSMPSCINLNFGLKIVLLTRKYKSIVRLKFFKKIDPKHACRTEYTQINFYPINGLVDDKTKGCNLSIYHKYASSIRCIPHAC